MLEKVFFYKNFQSIGLVSGSSPIPTGHAKSWQTIFYFYAQKPSLWHIIFVIFDGWVDEATSRYDDLTIEIGAFSLAIFSGTKSMNPNFFFIFGISNLWLNFGREMKQISMWEDFHANIVK